MDVKKILIGTIIWSLGMLLSIIAMNTLRDRYMDQHLLRWIAWVYLGAMSVVGSILVVDGFRTKASNQ